MNIENKAMGATFPMSVADATGARGVFRETTGTGNVSRALPTGIAGNFLDLQAITTAVQVSFSAAAQALVLDQASPFSGTPSAAAGFTIPAGVTLSRLVPADAKFINFISSGAGLLEGFMSESNRGVLSTTA